jgi:hypothetical protein
MITGFERNNAMDEIPAAKPPYIEIQNLTKSFTVRGERIAVLKGISL